MRVEEGERVEELTTPEGLALQLGQAGLLADVVPTLPDRVDLAIDELARGHFAEVVRGAAPDSIT